MTRAVGADGDGGSSAVGDVRAAGETREALATVLGPVVVTDVELGLLEEAHRRLLAEQPEAEPQPPTSVDGDEASRPGRVDAETLAARSEALRSLIARGILDGAGRLPEDGEPGSVVATLLDVRAASPRVLLVERVVAGPGPDHRTDRHVRGGCRLVYLVESGACVEDVLPDGSHHLYLELDLGQVALWVGEVAVPEDAVAALGPRLVVDPAQPEEMVMLLGRPTALVELSVLEPSAAALPAIGDGTAAPAHHLLALGPSGCWLTDVDPGRSLPDRVVFRPVGPGWVAEWVRSQLGSGGRTG